MQNTNDNVHIFRTVKTENPFAQIDKRLINDKSISWKTKGILIYLLSKPNDWTAQLSDIIGHSTDGRDAIRSAINEAVKAGYIKRIRFKNEKGRYAGIEYQVFESPIKSDKDIIINIETTDGKSVYGKSEGGKSEDGKSATTNNEYTNNKKETNNKYIHSGNGKFKKPSITEILAYCKERKNSIDPNRFYDHYESNGWCVGKNKMKDWKAAVRTWERNNFNKQEQSSDIPEFSEAG